MNNLVYNNFKNLKMCYSRVVLLYLRKIKKFKNQILNNFINIVKWKKEAGMFSMNHSILMLYTFFVRVYQIYLYKLHYIVISMYRCTFVLRKFGIIPIYVHCTYYELKKNYRILLVDAQ